MLTIADWNFITPFYINTMYNFPSFIRNWFSDSEYFYYNGRIRRNSFWYLEKLWGPGFYFMIFCDILVTFSCHKYRIKVTQLCNHRCLLLKNTTFCRCFTHVTDLFLSRYGQNGLLWYFWVPKRCCRMKLPRFSIRTYKIFWQFPGSQ